MTGQRETPKKHRFGSALADASFVLVQASIRDRVMHLDSEVNS
ncbi:hypothetical protein SynBIOSE41_02787 [Synechococcus sp. BIOS-E4-1]|nr:hypothetical protein SynBIOSE41_02787 [Synechococcus sp. BIOS-E4-1]